LKKKHHYAFLFTHTCSSCEKLIIHNLYILPIGENFISVVLPSGVLLKNGNSNTFGEIYMYQLG
jgi:hypothetical protein